jgi:hypothetical protein
MSVWSRAGSELTLSGTTSGRDSALGSASLLGEGSSCTTAEEEDQLSSAGAGTIIWREKSTLNVCWAGSELTLSGTTSGRDSALGSASLLGEGSSSTAAEEEDQLSSAGAGTIIWREKINFKCLPGRNLSGTTSGRDTALGSASLLGEGSSCTTPEEEDQLSSAGAGTVIWRENSTLNVGRAGSELTLSGTTSGRDSALGSASLLGEGSSCTTAEEEDQLSSAGAGTIIWRENLTLNVCRAGSELTLSGTTSGRDSALGSASLLGEGSSSTTAEEEDQLFSVEAGRII